MEQEHVRNISTLILFMEGLCDPRFDMARYAHDCDTPACALGWATTIPALRAKGLVSLHDLHGFKSATAIIDSVHCVFGRCFSDLFKCGLGLKIKTPQDWASHAREWLKAQGYGVVPPTADEQAQFRRFMDRLLAPLLQKQAAA